MAENSSLRFIDLFAGLGGFHIAMDALGHECVFACENNPELQDIYERNFGQRPAGDLRALKASDVPSHDVMCAGFPCQPFSKAGEQLGTQCTVSGDLFSHHVLRLLRTHRPKYFIFENVANLERHDGGRTWQRMRNQLERGCGYTVQTRILSPHMLGIPQIRERLIIVGCTDGLDNFEWPRTTSPMTSVRDVLDKNPKEARRLSPTAVSCLTAWGKFLRLAPANEQLPSFPIWGMEFGATYPFTKYDNLHEVPLHVLRNHRGSFGQTLNTRFRKEILNRVPSHARSGASAFPRWKQLFIRQNRDFYRRHKDWIRPWLPSIRQFPTSYQKLEWNCKGEERDIWKFVIQFRASGVRIKRPNTAPSLVAMSSTQVPVIAWEKRYMTPRECCRLQSMDQLQYLPEAPSNIYRALGNAVNARLVEHVVRSLLMQPSSFRRANVA